MDIGVRNPPLAKWSCVYSINHDLDFLDNLPARLDDLALYQYYALESYDISLEKLYLDDLLNLDYLSELHYENDPKYIAHVGKVKANALKGIKSKKFNDYKRSLRSNHVKLAV